MDRRFTTKAAAVLIGGAAPLLAAPGLATADPAPGLTPGIHLDSRIYVERVAHDLNGRARRTLLNAERATPGDRLVIILDWRHAGDRPAQGAFLARPLPPGTLLQSDDPAMLLSVDGGAHWGRLDQLWVRTATGAMRRAVTADITHIGWSLGSRIEPGESGRLSYRARAVDRLQPPLS